MWPRIATVENGRRITRDKLPEEMTEAEQVMVWRSTAEASRFQAKAALASAGLLASVEVAISSADDLTQLAWAEALTFKRNSPAIASVAAGLGLTDEQVDDLFRAAALIQA